MQLSLGPAGSYRLLDEPNGARPSGPSEPPRRRGLGRRLLDEATTVMRAEGVHLLALRVAESRTPMTSLPATSGFTLTPEHELAASHPETLEIADDEAPWLGAVRELGPETAACALP